MRVPLVIRWKGHLALEEPRVVEQQVRLIDLMPTLLTLAGIERQPAVMGRDLTPLLLGDALPEAPALCELLVDGRAMRALRTDGFKSIAARGRVGFDLADDPRELAPLRPPAPRVLAGLEELKRQLQAARGFDAGSRAEAHEVDPEVLERLRGLGYVGTNGGH